jgi:YidC/Oxa1 family membrane protein insertase
MLDFITIPMINVLLYIYNLLGDNFGIAIILFTVLIRLIILPLTFKQQSSTKKMQELQNSKQWQDIQKKYKDDKQKLQEETVRLYREMGINPLSGCLPLLIQFPIIIGLYSAIVRALADAPLNLLTLSQQLYNFIPNSLIPINSHFLWMDLGQPERLYLPFLPTFGIPILTILVVITTWLQGKLTTSATPDAQGAQMSQMMNLYMPLLLGYFAYTYASGLALYFVISNLFTVVQYAAFGGVDLRQVFSRKPAKPKEKK